jgi:hypothetical protein
MKFLFLKFEKMAIQEGNGKIEIFHLCHEKFDFFEKKSFLKCEMKIFVFTKGKWKKIEIKKSYISFRPLRKNFRYYPYIIYVYQLTPHV